MAEISMTYEEIQTGELIALQDSMLLCASDTLMEIPISRIKSLNLEIDESRGWIIPIILFQGLPSVILIVAKDEKEWGALGLGITAITWASFEFSGPRVTFDQPWRREDIDALRLHTRYPQGLTDEQMVVLRKSFAEKIRQ